VHPFALLVVSLVIVFAQLLGGKTAGLVSRVAWPLAALLAVVGAIAAWRR
jgi:hypothetical protein